MKRQYSGHGDFVSRKRQKYEEEEEEEGAFVVFSKSHFPHFCNNISHSFPSDRLDTSITIRDLVDDWLETYNDDAATGLILAINCLTKVNLTLIFPQYFCRFFLCAFIIFSLRELILKSPLIISMGKYFV